MLNRTMSELPTVTRLTLARMEDPAGCWSCELVVGIASFYGRAPDPEAAVADARRKVERYGAHRPAPEAGTMV